MGDTRDPPLGIASLPRDIVARIAGMIDPASRLSARLSCRDLDRAVVGQLKTMSAELFLRYAGKGYLSSDVKVFHGNAVMSMSHSKPAVVSSNVSDAGSRRPMTDVDRSSALCELAGIALFSPCGESSADHDELGTWVEVAKEYRLSGLELTCPSYRQLASAYRLRSEIRNLSLCVSTLCSTRRTLLLDRIVSAGKLEKLRVMIPDWPRIRELRSLAGCASLRSLEIHVSTADSCKTIASHAGCISRCRKLERLVMAFAVMDGSDVVSAICDVAKDSSQGTCKYSLREVFIRGNTIDDGNVLLKLATSFPGLTVLSARGLVEWRSEGIEAVSRMRCLRSLDLSGRPLVRRAARPGISRGLLWASARHETVGYENGSSMSQRFPELRRVDVSGCGADQEDIAWVASVGRLEYLDASDNNLTEPPAVHPDARPSVIDLSWNSMGHRSAEILTQPCFSCLTSLDLSSNDLMDYGAIEVAKAVGPGRSLSRVKHLFLDHNRLSESGKRFLEKEVTERLRPDGVSISPPKR